MTQIKKNVVDTSVIDFVYDGYSHKISEFNIGTDLDVTISNGIVTITTESQIPYVYGRDSFRLLEELRSNTGKSVFWFGDSRSVNPELHIDSTWVNIPLGGSSLFTANYGNVAIWTTSFNAFTETTPPLFNGLAYSGRSTAIAATVPEGSNWGNNSRMILGGGYASIYGSAFNLTNGCTVNCAIRNEATGVTGDNIALQAYVGANNSLSTTRRQSTFFSTYSPTTSISVVTLDFDNTTDWVVGPDDYALNVEIAYRSGQPTIVGETCTIIDLPWAETSDGTGAVIFDCSLSGSTLGQILSDDAMVPETLKTFLDIRASRSPWFIIDKGSNPTSGLVATKDWHIHQLRKAIAKLRTACGDQSARILLRTSYQSSTDSSTIYYQQAAIEVARRDFNVICVDTFGASVAGGGYSTAVTKGWMGDTVHRNTSGRAALERMFNAIVSGNSWTYLSDLG